MCMIVIDCSQAVKYFASTAMQKCILLARYAQSAMKTLRNGFNAKCHCEKPSDSSPMAFFVYILPNPAKICANWRKAALCFSTRSLFSA